MPANYKFEFRPLLTACVVISLGVLISLGTWQLHRLEWKRDLVARVEARADAEPIPFEEAFRRAEAGENMEYTPVKISGVFALNKEARIFGSYEGRPGFFSFAPLKRQGGGNLYVNRGFTRQAITAPDDAIGVEVEVVGLFRYAEQPSPPASWFLPAGQSADGFWFVRDPERFAEEAGIEAPPYYVDQFAVSGREWPKGGTTRLAFNNRHLEYALTWFGLAVTLVGVWLAFSLKIR